MNKKLLTISALALVAIVGLSSTVSAESSATATLGINANVGPSINAKVDADMKARGDDKKNDNRGSDFAVRGTFGTVTAINGTTLTIQSNTVPKGGSATAVTYTVNTANAKIDIAGEVSYLSNIKVGDMVIVEGTTSGSTITATKIHTGMVAKGGNKGDQNSIPNSNGQPIIGGKVTAISGNTITITNQSNVSYTIDASAAKITKNGTTSTVSTIAVGDSILAQGTVNGTSVTAVNIVDTNNTNNGLHVGFFGKIGGFFARIFGFSK